MQKSTTELERELNRALQDQKVLEAFEQFYADDVVMEENSGEPCRGKEANRQRTLEWAGTVSQFHGARLIGSAVSGDRAYSEWEYDVQERSALSDQSGRGSRVAGPQSCFGAILLGPGQVSLLVVS
jgi:hypothetical protein